ncbi:Arc family DNA-binding protein [Azotobacter chroococcum]|uniref:Arc family DNA-binding protein n=1 Tax=Azotobacter chroococcum TaxID=353 RepID=UPI0010AE2202|nr:Arc family DNA-binding protein [Azotobacter chroococcum]TKD32594.1 Arc family DNA-binding protein [Azotobacter chroococcum]
MSRKDPQVNMRIPEELLDILDGKAKENHRSRTAEVIFRLKQSVANDEQSKQASA